MKYISLFLITVAFCVSCSQAPENKPANSSVNKPSMVSPTNSATPVAAPPSTVSSVIPSAPIVSDGKVPLPEVELTSVPAPPVDQNNEVGNPMIRKGKQLVDQPATGPTPPPMKVPAGENSYVTTTMDRHGRFVETRVFKNHPQLVKAERVFIDATGSVLTLTLKDGRQVRGSGTSVPNMVAATAVDLMIAVGMKLQGNDPSATGARQ